MRRSLSVLFATVVGIVLIASFHSTPEPAAVTNPARSGVGASTSTTTSTVAGAAPPPSSTSTSPTTRRTYTGSEVDNRYGPVQVRIAVEGSRLIDVSALQLPSDRAHSARLSAEAGPLLRTEALRAQSARIDAVSGATFTSESYAQSLQAALDQAGLRG